MKANLTTGTSENHLKLIAFKVVCALSRCKDEYFVVEQKLSAQKVLKCFNYLCIIKDTFCMLLTCMFLVYQLRGP